MIEDGIYAWRTVPHGESHTYPPRRDRHNERQRGYGIARNQMGTNVGNTHPKPHKLCWQCTGRRRDQSKPKRSKADTPNDRRRVIFVNRCDVWGPVGHGLLELKDHIVHGEAVACRGVDLGDHALFLGA